MKSCGILESYMTFAEMKFSPMQYENVLVTYSGQIIQEYNNLRLTLSWYAHKQFMKRTCKPAFLPITLSKKYHKQMYEVNEIIISSFLS